MSIFLAFITHANLGLSPISWYKVSPSCKQPYWVLHKKKIFLKMFLFRIQYINVSAQLALSSTLSKKPRSSRTFLTRQAQAREGSWLSTEEGVIPKENIGLYGVLTEFFPSWSRHMPSSTSFSITKKGTCIYDRIAILFIHCEKNSSTVYRPLFNVCSTVVYVY